MCSRLLTQFGWCGQQKYSKEDIVIKTKSPFEKNCVDEILNNGIREKTFSFALDKYPV